VLSSIRPPCCRRRCTLWDTGRLHLVELLGDLSSNQFTGNDLRLTDVHVKGSWQDLRERLLAGVGCLAVFQCGWNSIAGRKEWAMRLYIIFCRFDLVLR
jgi:hypothetical protein